MLNTTITSSKFLHFAIIVSATVLLISMPAYAFASPYQKQPTSTLDTVFEQEVKMASDHAATCLDIVQTISKLDHIQTINENGHTYIIQEKDADAYVLNAIDAIAPVEMLDYGTVRYGHTVFNCVSTTALSRGDASTADLAKTLGVHNWYVDEDGFLKDGDNNIVCVGTTIAYDLGDIIETPAGTGKIYDTMFVGLDKVALYYEK